MPSFIPITSKESLSLVSFNNNPKPNRLQQIITNYMMCVTHVVNMHLSQMIDPTADRGFISYLLWDVQMLHNMHFWV